MANSSTETEMPAETLKALRGSIAKWEGIVAGTTRDEGPANCPLCKMFNRSDTGRVKCHGCPVRERSGEDGCSNTPYDDYEAYMGLVDEGEEEFEELRAKSLAQDELDFLKSLLPRSAT